MSRRMDFVRQAAARADELPQAAGPRHRRAVLAKRSARSPGRPTIATPSPTRSAAIAVQRAAPRSSTRSAALPSCWPDGGTPRDRADHRRLRRAQHGSDRGHAAEACARRRDPVRRSASAASPAFRSKASAASRCWPSRPAAARSSRRARTSLPTVHELIAADVQKRYLLTYTPTNQKADGTWRTITVGRRRRLQGEGEAGLLRAGAAAGPADDRVHHAATSIAD